MCPVHSHGWGCKVLPLPPPTLCAWDTRMRSASFSSWFQPENTPSTRLPTTVPTSAGLQARGGARRVLHSSDESSGTRRETLFTPTVRNPQQLWSGAPSQPLASSTEIPHVQRWLRILSRRYSVASTADLSADITGQKVRHVNLAQLEKSCQLLFNFFFFFPG